jgi:hypothetical protein
MWIALAILVYSIGSQIPREIRLYLESRRSREEIKRHAHD